MAVIPQPAKSSFSLFELPEGAIPAAGTFLATCLDVKDEYGVLRRKFESEEMEKVDLTAFLFGYRDEANAPHKIASKAMKISGNEKAALMVFLKQWLGRSAAFGWDYAEMKGKQAMLTVSHEPRRDGNGVYASIINVSPVPACYAKAAPAGTAPAKRKPAPAPAPVAPPPVEAETTPDDADLPF